MTSRRSWAVAGAVALLAAAVLSMVVASGQDAAQGTDARLIACETAHPEVGGNVYCYVLTQGVGARLTIFENEEHAATFELKLRRGDNPSVMRTGVADPAVGGHVYCYLVHGSSVYIFRNAEYVGKDTLSRRGQEI